MDSMSLRKLESVVHPDQSIRHLYFWLQVVVNLYLAPVAPKVVIMKRQKTRVLQDAEALQAALLTAGMTSSILQAGTMDFKQQVLLQQLSISSIDGE